jgi:hypothetical protein
VDDSPQHGADRYGYPEFQRNLALDCSGFVKTWVLGLGRLVTIRPQSVLSIEEIF